MSANEIFNWISALATLTALEIVLGIDNIVLISIAVGKLPKARQPTARRIGLFLALGARLVLLAAAAWLASLTQPLLRFWDYSFSARELIFIGGGLFLLSKATMEIVHFVEGQASDSQMTSSRASYGFIIGQIIVFDLVFSFDSVLTAIGLAEDFSVMATAVILSVVFMMAFAQAIGNFVQDNPGIKMLALSFLVMIGILLMAEGFGSHFNRGYVYFAMTFSLAIELLNRRRIRKTSVTKRRKK